MNFIQKYWNGQFSLARSFWIVFFIFGSAFHLISYLLLGQVANTSSSYKTGLITYLVTGFLILFPWQAIGLLRSAEFHYKKFGRPVVLHTVQAFILVSFIVITSHFVGLVQTLSINQSFDEFKSTVKPQKYTIALIDGGNQLALRGTLDFGITKAVRTLLKTHPNIKQIVLESEGGQIYEGRGLAILFQQFGVDTYSDSYCLSSCTTAFIGGVNRYLGEKASLGFHQYGFDSTQLQTFQSFYDLDEEQNKDLELYRLKNIEEDFIQQIFQKPNHEIWYPSKETLLKAGVVTEIIYPDKTQILE